MGVVRFEREGDLVIEEFDYCVTCTGMYSGNPHLPLPKGAGVFQGEILHSCTFLDKEQVKGKRVVVVGGGKSAVDNAVSAAKAGTSSTLLYRDAHWPVPRYLLNLIPFQWGTYSRLGHFMLHASHDMSAFATWFHAVLVPLKWLFWRIVELMFRVQFRLSGEAVPDTPIEIDLFTGGQILTYEYRNMLKAGQVQGLKGSIDHFVEDGVVLTDGTQIPADVVIYGTGFGKSYEIFDKATQQKLAVQRDGLYLYRNIVPAAVPNLQQRLDSWIASRLVEEGADRGDASSIGRRHAPDSGEGAGLEAILDACFQRSCVHLAATHDEVSRQFVRGHAGALQAQRMEYHG